MRNPSRVVRRDGSQNFPGNRCEAAPAKPVTYAHEMSGMPTMSYTKSVRWASCGKTWPSRGQGWKRSGKSAHLLRVGRVLLLDRLRTMGMQSVKHHRDSRREECIWDGVRPGCRLGGIGASRCASASTHTSRRASSNTGKYSAGLRMKLPRVVQRGGVAS